MLFYFPGTGFTTGCVTVGEGAPGAITIGEITAGGVAAGGGIGVNTAERESLGFH